MPWQSHLDGASHLGQIDTGTAAEAAPQIHPESPTGTPILAQPAPFWRIGQREIMIILATAVVTYFVMTRMKKRK